MGIERTFFRLLVFINGLIMLYTLYCSYALDYEWCGYTFIGVSLWTLGIIFVTLGDKTPRARKIDNLLDYPLISLVVFVMLLHASTLFDFLIKVILLSVVSELVIYASKQKLTKNVLLVYYSALLILAWVFLYKYPLIPLTYSLFIVYCEVNSSQLVNQLVSDKQCQENQNYE